MADEPTRPAKRRPTRPVGETIGGILVGFDQQIMRNQPPAQELVQKGAPVRGLAGDDAGALTIVLPAGAVEPPAVEPPQAEPPGVEPPQAEPPEVEPPSADGVRPAAR